MQEEAVKSTGARDVAERADKLASRYGELLGPDVIRHVLGFRTPVALRQAINRKSLKLRMFSIPGRKGKFTTPRDIAQYIVEIEAAN